jgi:nanoRNase/pAp phosphatase (c-di-AMP/oligoRNAs hydrolase)
MTSLNDAKNLIAKAQNICLLPSKNIQGDILAATLALFYSLEKINKNVNTTTLKKIPEQFQFLNNNRLLPAKNLTISVDTSQKEIQDIKYEKNDKNLKIHLTCAKGALQEKDILMEAQYEDNNGLNPVELLITLGVKSLEDLNLSDKEIQSLSETPILNIDNQPSNENFGEVNLINLCSSLCEIVVEVIKSTDEALLDENIATQLLSGIIWSSQNFKNPNVRSKTFETASYLIEKKADHTKIIQRFYKTKPISRVKLLGRVLEKIIFNKEKELYQILLSRNDFQNSETSSKDLGFVIEELRANFWIPSAPCPNLLILWESHGSKDLTKGIFYSTKLDSIKSILDNFEGISKDNRALFIIREKNIKTAQAKTLSALSDL